MRTAIPDPVIVFSGTLLTPMVMAVGSPLSRQAPAPLALACADHAHNSVPAGKSPQHPSERATERAAERATERVAVLMTPTEKAAYADRANSLGLSLGQFFREAGAAYAHRNAEAETRSLAEAEALDAALRQLELSTSRTEQTLDVALAEVRAALGAQP